MSKECKLSLKDRSVTLSGLEMLPVERTDQTVTMLQSSHKQEGGIFGLQLPVASNARFSASVCNDLVRDLHSLIKNNHVLPFGVGAEPKSTCPGRAVVQVQFSGSFQIFSLIRPLSAEGKSV